ncbi:hypothetical protein C7974DRAFT_372014 [Boeremia exigua]|uniref:uncharacterized protein n=1 Tax=Boeremia exigua TaxID=749465 RepID=UPI001E8EB1FC|nr:uncharacterized protein C7974DRAFT_372014 [Boeremia exigua]KAH6642018.1 hypothetical protein C7974DRAFT_372014 [Boeremia exigua]
MTLACQSALRWTLAHAALLQLCSLERILHGDRAETCSRAKLTQPNAMSLSQPASTGRSISTLSTAQHARHQQHHAHPQQLGLGCAPASLSRWQLQTSRKQASALHARSVFELMFSASPDGDG